MDMARIGRPALWGCAVAFAAIACSSEPPSILTIPETTVNVSSTVQFDVAATDPDTDKLVFAMKDGPKGAQLNQIEGKFAKFSWTPNAAQVGVHTITFTASDGSTEDTETVNIKVVGGGAPELLSADRYVVDLNTTSLVKFVLELRDDDSAELAFEFDPDPADWGAELKTSAKKVFFSWEPDEAARGTAQHSFVLKATDTDENLLQRTITVIFRGVANDSCVGSFSPPTVVLTEIANQTGDDDYAVVAECADTDTDIDYAVVFWSTVADPKDNDWEYKQLTAGDRAEWVGAIPNLGLSPNDGVATVTWHVCAADKDDPNGDRCDGWSCAANQTFTVSSKLSLCDPCEAGQCGDDICIENRVRGEKFCGGACGANRTCPAGFYCEDIDADAAGNKLPQCVPSGCQDGAGAPTCSCSAGRPVAPAVGEVVINEVLFDPSDSCPEAIPACTTAQKLSLDVNGDGIRKKDEGEEEFIEIVNNTTGKYLDLTGAVIADADRDRFTFPAFVLPPGRGVVVFGGGDQTKFATLGGAFKFSSSTQPNGSLLQLNNAGDTVTLKLRTTTLDTVTWTSTIGKNQSIVRQKEGDKSALMKNHTTATGSSGSAWSPGTHVCRTPFPLDVAACLPPTCTVTNQDQEPASDSRPTAPCLKPFPQTVTTTLRANQADASTNDVRDLFVIEARANQWLHARTEAGVAPQLEDTVLKLMSRSGELITSNDDDDWDHTSSYSRIVHQFPADGVYYVEVTPYVFGISPVAGSYKLTVELLAAAPTQP